MTAKMGQKTIFITWKTFPTHLASTFQDLIKEGHFADVTLVSDEQVQIPAHKIVLSACSPVLKNLLLNNPHSHPLLYMRGVQQQELQSILQFMYLGKATIYKDRIDEFMDIAIDLEVKELSKDDESNTDLVDTEEEPVIVETEEEPVIVDSKEEPVIVDIKEEPVIGDTEKEPVIVDAFIHDNQTSSSSTLKKLQLQDFDTPESDDKNNINPVTNSKVFSCQNCESVFKSQSGLMYHYEGIQ
jgi:hypothetical protein